MSDWTTFGRVDADGTVYVKTAEGERVVGSWQAGSPEEGLAHFARRFADLVTEVDLTEARLGSGAADAAHSLATIRRLRGSLAEAHVVGDIDGLAARLDKLATVAEEQGRRGARRPRGRPRRGAGPQDRPGRGGREAGGRVDRLEDGRRPAQGDPRRVEDDPRGRQEGRRRAVEAVRGRPGRLHPPPRRPLRHPRRAAQAGAGRQGGAGRRGRVALRVDRLGADRRPAQGAHGPVEGRAARLQGGRAEAVGEVPRRAGRVLHPAQRGLLRARRRAEGQPGAQAGAARRGGGARRRRRPAGRAGQAARDPGPVARRRPGAARGRVAGLDRRMRAVEEKVRDRRWTPPGGAPSRRPTRC